MTSTPTLTTSAHTSHTTDMWTALFKREWLQHRTGWLVMLLLPPLLFLLAVAFGSVQFDADDTQELAKLASRMPTEALPGLVGLAVALMAVYLSLGVLLAANLMMAGGLARKDDEDRSVEFWLSLPTPHHTSVGATLLAHAVLLPLLGLLVALAVGVLAGIVATLRAYGLAGVGQMFAHDAPALFANVSLRILAGLPLAVFWVAPVYLAIVAAGAWFKRWGLPLVIAGVATLHVLASRLWGVDIVAQTVGRLFENGLASVFVLESLGQKDALSKVSPDELTSGRLWAGFVDSAATLASPFALCALLFSAAMVALLVWRRQRGR